MHLQLGLDLAHGVKRNADHDEDRGAAECLHELVAREVEDDGRHNRDDRNEDSARKRNVLEDVLDVLDGRCQGECPG